MKTSLSSNGDFKNTIRWLNKATETKPTEIMNEIGRDGVNSLSSNTPKDTGETAASWGYRITGEGQMTEIEWFNSAHPEALVNVAKLIELGHGTENGGFVQPRPYIHISMNSVFKEAGDKIEKEVNG